MAEAATNQAWIEAVKQAYAALNRNDVPAFVRDFDPLIERQEPADFPGGGIYRGLDAVKAHVAFHRSNWAEGGCEPQRFLTVGDKVIAFVQVRVRLKNEAQWREGRVADGFAFRNGKIVKFRTFFDEQEALKWAGVEDSGSR